jgi:hypothetical protein
MKQTTPALVTDAATLTVAEMLSGIISGTQSSGSTNNLTLPTGTAMDAALPGFAIDDAFDVVVLNKSAAAADTYTLVAGTGFTIEGAVIVESSHTDAETNAGTFRCRKSAANTFIAYRIS